MRALFLAVPLTFAVVAAVAQDATPAPSGDPALVVGNGDYADLDAVERGALLPPAAAGLEENGFALDGGADLNARRLYAEATEWVEALPDAGRAVAALSGRFATDGTRTWFLATNTKPPSPIEIARRAILVQTLLEALGRVDGPAVLLLGTDDYEADWGPGLRPGLGPINPPEGVTVATGTVGGIEALMRSGIAQPGQSLGAALRSVRGVTLLDDAGGDVTLIPAPEAQTAPEAPAEPAAVDRVELPDDLVGIAEETAWNFARSIDTENGYVRYLDRFPAGAHAAEAVARLEELRNTPSDPNAAAEAALDLTPGVRTQVQRDLTTLGFDTNGIDGIFGSGTRAAIRDWQSAGNRTATGYVTRDDINALSQQAAVRTREMEAERARRDEDLWTRTRAANDLPAYRTYLEAFPQGAHAAEARRAVEALTAERRDTDAERDRDAWDIAREADTRRSYRAYLDRPGQGAFDTQAQRRLDELVAAAQARRQQTGDSNSNRNGNGGGNGNGDGNGGGNGNGNGNGNGGGARAIQSDDEARLGLDRFGLQLVESQLAALGLNPGTVDGVLDDDSRGALRRYQSRSGLDATGFLDRLTLDRLLVDSLR